MFTAVMSLAMLAFVAVARVVFIMKMDELEPKFRRPANDTAHG